MFNALVVNKDEESGSSAAVEQICMTSCPKAMLW